MGNRQNATAEPSGVKRSSVSNSRQSRPVSADNSDKKRYSFSFEGKRVVVEEKDVRKI